MVNCVCCIGAFPFEVAGPPCGGPAGLRHGWSTVSVVSVCSRLKFPGHHVVDPPV